MRAHYVWLLTMVVMVALGCFAAHQLESTTSESVMAAPTNARPSVTRGMPQARVLALLGEPSGRGGIEQAYGAPYEEQWWDYDDGTSIWFAKRNGQWVVTDVTRGPSGGVRVR